MKAAPAVPNGSTDPPDLIFQWERPTHAHWRLGGIITLSLLAHALSFYVLQVAYTPTGSLPPPPARMMMIPRDQPGNDAFSRWLAMADPSLIVQPTESSTDETLAAVDFHYVPSYQSTRPGFKSLDPLPGEGAVTAPPRPRAPGPVPVRSPTSERAMTRRPEPPADRRTQVTLTGGGESLLTAPLPPVNFKTAKPLEPTAFLVGVRPEGGAPLLFLEPRVDPRGKTRPDTSAADEFARDYLARLDFRPPEPAPGGVRWFWAEFHWGNDVYRPTGSQN